MTAPPVGGEFFGPRRPAAQPGISLRNCCVADKTGGIILLDVNIEYGRDVRMPAEAAFQTGLNFADVRLWARFEIWSCFPSGYSDYVYTRRDGAVYIAGLTKILSPEPFPFLEI